MKGAILAGGLGTRLYPLTYATNKHLLPVYNQPMIFYPIQTLVKAGITEVVLVSSGPHVGHFIRVIRNGKELGLKHIEYAYQENPQGGIADALSVCEEFADHDNLAVILGDNTTDFDIGPVVREFKEGACVFVRQVPDPQRYGVPVFDPNDPTKIIAIEEKPKAPKSNFSVTGIYLYDKQVFDFIRQCQPSDRGEMEITDVNNLYIKKNLLNWTELKGYWQDAGKFETLFAANCYWAKKNGVSCES
jgi:glucose-1-phosphate thymidylyltransferase